MDLMLLFWVVYAVTVLFVGLSFTLHLDTSKVPTSQLLVMLFFGLCPVLNTVLLLVSFRATGTLQELQKELEELEKRNRKD